jgi:DNA-binding MarR family transcriptional regulator
MAGAPGRAAPVTELAISRLLVLANLLRRGAALRYRRLLDLSSTELGLVAMLGRREPVSAARIAELMGRDKGQISRALSDLVSRKLVARSVNSRDNREMLLELTRAGLAAHETIVEVASERNAQLLAGLARDEKHMLFSLIDRLTAKATDMLEMESKLGDEG